MAARMSAAMAAPAVRAVIGQLGGEQGPGVAAGGEADGCDGRGGRQPPSLIPRTRLARALELLRGLMRWREVEDLFACDPAGVDGAQRKLDGRLRSAGGAIGF
jgi:hypothetical protein